MGQCAAQFLEWPRPGNYRPFTGKEVPGYGAGWIAVSGRGFQRFQSHELQYAESRRLYVGSDGPGETRTVVSFGDSRRNHVNSNNVAADSVRIKAQLLMKQ